MGNNHDQDTCLWMRVAKLTKAMAMQVLSFMFDTCTYIIDKIKQSFEVLSFQEFLNHFRNSIQVRDVESPFRRSRKAFSGPIIAFSGPIFALFGSDNCPFRPRSERAIIGPEKGNYRTRKGNYRTRKSQLSDPKRLIIGPEKAIIGGPEKAIIGPEKGNYRTKKGQLSDPKRPIIGPEKANYQTRKGQLYNCRLLQSSIKSSQ